MQIERYQSIILDNEAKQSAQVSVKLGKVV
jgi:hypothetical protein